MRKILKKHEGPIDNLMIDIAEKVSSTFHSVKFTANGITTLSLVFGLFAAFFLFKGWILLFGLSYFISYFFDIMDGYYARRYKMTSSIGDWYDHVKDISVGVAIILILFFKYRNNCSWKVWAICGTILLVITLLSFSFVGCQNKIYKKGDATKIADHLCPGKPKKNIKWLRYFDTGVLTLTIIILVSLITKVFCK